jgi:hypothetical protein
MRLSRRHIAHLAAAALLCLPMTSGAVIAPSAATDSTATTLKYDTYKGKSRVGGARVVIQRDEQSYEIHGQAWSEGFAKLLSNWESDFAASGTFDAGKPVLERYSLVQRMRNKIRKIFFRDGRTEFIKEDDARVIENPPTSADFISALFMTQDCHQHAEVHNGKDAFRIALRDVRSVEIGGGEATQCTFDVTDEDDEQITAILRLSERDGLMVPVRLDFSGALQASFQLRGGA